MLTPSPTRPTPQLRWLVPIAMIALVACASDDVEPIDPVDPVEPAAAVDTSSSTPN